MVIAIPTAIPYGRIWITRYGSVNIPSDATQITLDVQESTPKTWYFKFTDANAVIAEYHVQSANGKAVCDLSLLPANFNRAAITEISLGAEAPLDTAYTATIDNLQDNAGTVTPPPPPPTEPEPPITSQISVFNNEVLPFSRAVWYPWFLDTPAGWFVRAGETWNDSNYTRWDEAALRACLENMRDTFKANMVRIFFWMENYLSNSTATMSTLYPTAQKGLKEALHRFVQIAAEEGLAVELRMWDWNSAQGKTTNPLATHSAAQFIAAWTQFANDFKSYDNVVFNLFDEPDESIGSFAIWKQLALDTILAIRTAGIAHVIYVHWKYCGGEGIQWIRNFGNHYQVAFSRHDYIQHGTTEQMHLDTIAIKNEGYPATMTAGGPYYNDPGQRDTYLRWYQEYMANNIGISIYQYGRPYLPWQIQQNVVFPMPPNETGAMWILAITGQGPLTYTLTLSATGGGQTTPPIGVYIEPENAQVTLTATPSSGYTFKQWTINGAIQTMPTTIVSMNQNILADAVFEQVITPPPTPQPTIAARSIGPLGAPSALLHQLWRLRERFIRPEVHRKLHPLV